VPVRKVRVDTQFETAAGCGGSGRNLAGATVQWWNGSAWVDAGNIAGKSDDWEITLPSTVSTTMVRLYGVHTGTSGQASNPILYEWDVFACP
jgi:hypothetical protein